ncbi:hypothetical protein HHK36_013212 [Tetracentron sinense]|uniref:SANTA domain-containing protein n=1 Tax=Tetracentron sinense TaxID=13715 RepID=A0A834Z8C1_TETSI|nr:hypothetical protein HHK36_013212 [Tetracentron sinense]
MATRSTTTRSSSSNRNMKTNSIPSPFLRTVYLQDWWLVKAESNLNGKRLAVGGFALRERQAVRVFCSAPIIKRHDTITLETEDGITIMIKGFINKSRTHENGFSSEVCNHFLFGFPYYWEAYGDLSFGKESTSRGVPISMYGFDGFTMSSDSSASRPLSVCSDDFPVTRIRDLLMSTAGNSESSALTNSIFTDILGKCSGSALKSPRVLTPSDMKSDSPPVTGVYVPEEAPTNHKKANSKQKHRNDRGPAENVNMRLAEERDNFDGDNCVDPVNEFLRTNSIMKRSDKVTHDASRDSMLKVNTEVVSLSKVGSEMPNGTSNNCDLSGMGSLKRKGRFNSMLESKYLTRLSSRLQSSKSNTDDTSEMITIHPSEMGMNVPKVSPTKVVARRRSNRLMNFKTKQEENLTSNSFVKPDFSEPNEWSFASKAFENPGGKKMTRSSSNVSHVTLSYGGGGMDNKEIPSKSTVKRSKARPKK